ncbi:MAG: hypothetical protein JW751_27955 [Polyangiaceae bacterium]|nr:hypothetical protein [Polyangiaceae bacterium]
MELDWARLGGGLPPDREGDAGRAEAGLERGAGAGRAAAGLAWPLELLVAGSLREGGAERVGAASELAEGALGFWVEARLQSGLAARGWGRADGAATRRSPVVVATGWAALDRASGARLEGDSVPGRATERPRSAFAVLGSTPSLGGAGSGVAEGRRIGSVEGKGRAGTRSPEPGRFSTAVARGFAGVRVTGTRFGGTRAAAMDGP